jgi:uncharacterized membrane protein
MKISLNKYPLDIILCILWTAILLPIALFDVNGPIRILLGIPFILFVPGYLLLFAFFPDKSSEKGIDSIERIILSVGISIAIVPLTGLILNYTVLGIRLEPMVILLSIFSCSVGVIAWYRWSVRTPEERFNVSQKLLTLKSEHRFDKPLNIVLIIVIITSVILLIYVISTPKVGEKFTEFYVLGPTGIADLYPQNLSKGENATVLIGISNHEDRKINYHIGIWLVNQSTLYNETTDENNTIINHIWFVDEVTIQLNNTQIDLQEPWTPQWQYNYSFNISREGHFKLSFLLYTTPVEKYFQDYDYKDNAESLFKNVYKEIHLWITVR